MHKENTVSSLPVVTIGDADRIFNDFHYRERCVNRIAEISLYVENYRGARREFVPRSWEFVMKPLSTAIEI